MVILDENRADVRLRKALSLVGFEEKAAFITEYLGLNEQNVRDFGRDKLHGFSWEMDLATREQCPIIIYGTMARRWICESGAKVQTKARVLGNQAAMFWRQAAPAVLRSGWFWLILSGYLLRLVVAPITGQHDVLFMPWQAHFITQGHFNLYAYLYDQFGEVVLRRPGVWAPYPYGFYAYTASWWWLLDKLQLVDLTGWQSVWQVTHPARYIYLQKLAYLPFDLAIGVIFLQAFPGNPGRWAWAMWAWAPMAIYTPWLMGQNDIYATAFMTAAIYAAGRAGEAAEYQSRNWDRQKAMLAWGAASAVLLGVGATFKVFPLLLLPILALFVSRRWFIRFGYLLLGGGVFCLAALPFISTPAYRAGVLFNREGLQLFLLTDVLGVRLALVLDWLPGAAGLDLNTPPGESLAWEAW